MKRDPNLDTLLALNAVQYWINNDYWVKFDVKLVKTITPEIPHGISYSLTLHDQYNNRIVGFDNAHAVKPKKRKFSGKIITWDHKHLKNKTVNYEFENAGQLIEDFWKEVTKIVD